MTADGGCEEVKKKDVPNPRRPAGNTSEHGSTRAGLLGGGRSNSIQRRLFEVVA